MFYYYPYKVYIYRSKKSDMKNVCWILNTEIRSIVLKKDYNDLFQCLLNTLNRLIIIYSYYMMYLSLIILYMSELSKMLVTQD